MTQHSPRAGVEQYLTELERELAALPFTPAHELYAEIEAELMAMTDEAAAKRIAALGTPASIAGELAQALVDAEPADAEPAEAQQPSSVLQRTPYILITSFTVAIGGFVIPIVGWIAGIVLMWISPVWSKLQKFLTTLAPLLAIPIVFILRTFMSESGTPAGSVPGGANPLVPAEYDLVWSGVLFATVPVFVSGVILLVIGMRRASRSPKD